MFKEFSDKHKFYCKNLTAMYKMVDHAVPPSLAFILAKRLNLSYVNSNHRDLAKRFGI